MTTDTCLVLHQINSSSFFLHPSIYRSSAVVNSPQLPPPPALAQLSQCNVNDVPSIATDSARTLTSLLRPVIPLSSPLPPPARSHTCHLSSLPSFPCFSLSATIIYVSLWLSVHCSSTASALSSSLGVPPSFIQVPLHFRPVVLQPLSFFSSVSVQCHWLHLKTHGPPPE